MNETAEASGNFNLIAPICFPFATVAILNISASCLIAKKGLVDNLIANFQLLFLGYMGLIILLAVFKVDSNLSDFADTIVLLVFVELIGVINIYSLHIIGKKIKQAYQIDGVISPSIYPTTDDNELNEIVTDI